MTAKSLVIFIPSIEGYGVEKNLFIILNFLSKHFRKIVLISATKSFNKKFNKNIKFLNPSNKYWTTGGRFKKTFICSLILISYLFSHKNTLVFSFQANLYSTLISKLMGSNIIIRLNSAPSGWSQNFIKKYIFKCLFLLADKIIVNSLEFKKEIKKKFNINSICIYNPLNKDEIIYKSKIITKKIFRNKNFLKIISVGRLVNQKNQILLLQAVKYLTEKRNINLELILVGDGDLRENFINFIMKNKLQKFIKIIKYNSNPYNLIAQANLFILTSKFEGLPNVLLEAITLNKFVISSNCSSGPKEILLNGKGGLLFKSNNFNDLCNKILFFLQNKKKCLKMLLCAKKNLIRFDYNKSLDKYLSVIRKY